MINIIKSEIKRLIKSKGFYLSLAIFIMIYVICIFMQTSVQNSSTFETSQSAQDPGFYITIDTVVKSLDSFATSFGHSFGTLIFGIYLAIFVCHEYSSGYMKNIATLSHGRTAIIISKSVVSLLIDIALIILCYSISFILGILFIDGFEIESIGIIFHSLTVMFLLSLAMFSCVIFITTLFRNKVAGIVLTFFISSGMLQPFIIGIFDFIHLSFLSQYSLSALFMNSISLDIELIKIVSISLFYIIIYNMISIGIMQKRDLQ